MKGPFSFASFQPRTRQADFAGERRQEMAERGAANPFSPLTSPPRRDKSLPDIASNNRKQTEKMQDRMAKLLRILAAGGLIALAAPGLAQETQPIQPTGETAGGAAGETPAAPATTPDPDAPASAENPVGLNMGEEVRDENAPGTIYVREKHGDWEIRCTRMPEGQQDPCLMYQLLKDENGNPVAEFTLFKLPEGQKAEAGATIVTPLETLLTRQLTLTVDGGPKKRYPFTWCAQNGCYARIGFTKGDIAAFKRGAKATVTIVPVVAPTTEINVTASLKGFTKAYEAVSKANQSAGKPEEKPAENQ